MAKYHVAHVDDVPVNDGIAVEIEGIPIAVFNHEGQYFAIHDRCIHKGGPLSKGHLNAELSTVSDRISVHCPWHYWEFDLETGRSIVGNNKLRTFDVTVEENDIVIEL